MKQVLVREGNVVVETVPAPLVEPGTVLVRVDHSCISTGTEVSGIRASGQSLLRRALKRPDQIKKAVGMLRSQGMARMQSTVKGRLSAGRPIGYSAAGVVLEIGDGVENIQPGERVACAGSQCAYHAEIIRVPRNLVTTIPQGVDSAIASTVALGAIAMQGVRRADPSLGESFVVIGLGALGQLSVQMLRANGCRVIGTDLEKERAQTAIDGGMEALIHHDDNDEIDQVLRFTDGFGADGVIITASTQSHEVVSRAFKMCRRKGRVVLVGDVGLHLERSDFYHGELDFLISTSYGPGRYDESYESGGIDYPLPYVRWTENRNMAAYLRLIEDGKVLVKPLLSEIYPVEFAPDAYRSLREKLPKPLLVLLKYGASHQAVPQCKFEINSIPRSRVEGKIRMAVVGSGGFAKGMHLPNLNTLSDSYHIRTIASRTGHNAMNTAKQFGADMATTDYEEILKDPEVDAVLIATRHDLHAEMVQKALTAGKHVLVEKPLALNKEELEGIMNTCRNGRDSGSMPVLMTGFNRRFSPFACRIKEMVSGRTNPMILNYRMNAGYIPLDHWVHGNEGGGRNIGEACHIYDLFTFLAGGKVTDVQARAVSPKTAHYSRYDNFVCTISFDEGSVATLTYTALGNTELAKERMDIFVDGKVMVLDDYGGLDVYGSKAKALRTRRIEKGHLEELLAFARTIQTGVEWPIPLWEQAQAMEIAFEVQKQLLQNSHNFVR